MVRPAVLLRDNSSVSIKSTRCRMNVKNASRVIGLSLPKRPLNSSYSRTMTPFGAQDVLLQEDVASKKLQAPHADSWKFEIIYLGVFIFGYLHISAIYGIYLCFTEAYWSTIVFSYILLVLSLMGVLAGSHRLWSHKSYKAKMPLQIILIIFNSVAGQYSAYNWVRDHRLHHKYSDTDADPHNASRGLFFSHFGWLVVKKHPEVARRGKTINMSDMLSNPVIAFQRKYAFYFITFFCYVFPTTIPIYFWSETFINAWHINTLRFALVLNFVSLINSAAHAFGTRPYDKNILSTENHAVTIATLGEGFHNYHHTFPWDYRAAELGNHAFNVTTKFIDFFAWVGWAYDLKTAAHDSVIRKVKKLGDSSYSGECDAVSEGNDDSKTS